MSYFRKSSRHAPSSDDFVDISNWKQEGNSWRCLLCADAKPQKLSNALDHDKSSKHMTARFNRAAQKAKAVEKASTSAAKAAEPAPSASTMSTDWAKMPAALAAPGDLLDLMSNAFESKLQTAHAPKDDNDVDMHTSFDDTAASDAPVPLLSAAEERAAAQLARDLLRREYRDDPDMDFGSDDEDCERDESDMDFDQEPSLLHEIGVEGTTAGRRNLKHRRDGDEDPDNPWFPWANKQECSLDVLMHLRRSALSRNQMSLIIWLAMFNGAKDMPSERQMQDSDKLLQDLCGIETIDYIGAMGNRFSVNSLADMLAQEWANPLVSPHLRTLPEDSGQRVQEAWHAEQWMERLPLDLATPMIRQNNLDYYVFEPARLSSDIVCMPFRWFTREGEIFARAWTLLPVTRTDENGVITEGWQVLEYDDFEVSASMLQLPMPLLEQRRQLYNIPSPQSILGSYISVTAHESRTLSPWTRTDPVTGNRWRALSNGARVKAVPIWLYGDDTSGNQSKKWNKHISFLFTLAGLPREHAQKEFNIHFLTTSNIAPPMELLDAVVSQIEECQESGVWAYDCHEGELVLLIPSVFAMLGDNPMQSEFCCHIGMRGRLFCRMCLVKGKTRKAKASGGEEGDAGDASDTDSTSGESEASASAASDVSGVSTRSKTTTTRKIIKETLQEMVDRVRRFTKVGEPRSKSETVVNLGHIRDAAFQKKNAKQDFTKQKTKFGLKDTFFEPLAQRLFDAVKKKRGRARSQAAEAFKATLPPELLGPLWRLDELDPHQDTPVEILHVVLLGIIKYFWRDAVKNQCKSPHAKAELIARLNSFDTSGLGIPPLRGETLVTYAGSLVGRDFRAIAQSAPFTLHGLVTEDCYRAWTYLANLVPQVWQPEISDMDAYVNRLSTSINDFLAAAAQWTPQWFNKPKFHVLLHLPAHIRRFGPAILFATEGFESFNAVIRVKSIHSNRQAPSRDIARAFAQGDRVRHLLSGGFFFRRTSSTARQSQPPIDLSKPKSTRRNAYTATRPQLQPGEHPPCAGASARALPLLHPVVRKYLGIPTSEETIPGTLEYAKPRQVLVGESETAQKTGSTLGLSAATTLSRCTRIRLRNGDCIKPGDWILYRRDVAPGPAAAVDPQHGDTNAQQPPAPFMGRVHEILEVPRIDGLPDHILLLSTPAERPTSLSTTYHMPIVPSLTHWEASNIKHAVCSVNVQHDCAESDCKATGQRFLLQERQLTERSIPVLSHVDNDKWILNTSQMRDACHVRQLALAPQPLDLETCIMNGATAIVRREKAAKRAAATAAGNGIGTSSHHTAGRPSPLAQQPLPMPSVRFAGGTAGPGLPLPRPMPPYIFSASARRPSQPQEPVIEPSSSSSTARVGAHEPLNRQWQFIPFVPEAGSGPSNSSQRRTRSGSSIPPADRDSRFDRGS